VRLRHPKGGAEDLRRQPIEVFREQVVATAPLLAPHIGDVGSWSDVKLLTVAVDRLLDWSRPGLLCIGDAAHAMSPVGGVGINLAIQDAVAAANLLAAKLRAARALTEDDLDEGPAPPPLADQGDPGGAGRDPEQRAGAGDGQPRRRAAGGAAADAGADGGAGAAAAVRPPARHGRAAGARALAGGLSVLRIRPLGAQDQAMLWEWLHVSLWNPPPAPPRPREVLRDPSVRIYAENWGRAGDLGVVGEIDGEVAPIGACWMRIMPPESAWPTSIPRRRSSALRSFSRFRRQGHGRRLMQAALERRARPVAGRWRSPSIRRTRRSRSTRAAASRRSGCATPIT
jgi:GNAT superfamily N-acetyltransferase